MTGAYEEILAGETVLRPPPDTRHEQVCHRLYSRLQDEIANHHASRLLEMRSLVEITTGTLLRPDVSIVTAATGKPWLVIEVVNTQDHRVDTVMKKSIYEDVNIPRLWMVDPRYDNVEVYHGSRHGLALQRILAGRENLEEQLLPGFTIQINRLFKGDAPD